MSSECGATAAAEEWGTPKSRRSNRAVPLADRVPPSYSATSTAGVPHRQSLVFCHPQPGNPSDASKLRERFYFAMDAAGTDEKRGRRGGITFHSLRHKFGTLMASVGAPVRTLQEWVVRRDFTTTLIYADFALDPSGVAPFAERAFGSRESRRPGAALDRPLGWLPRGSRQQQPRPASSAFLLGCIDLPEAPVQATSTRVEHRRQGQCSTRAGTGARGGGKRDRDDITPTNHGGNHG